jgi:antitoxin HigA-1
LVKEDEMKESYIDTPKIGDILKSEFLEPLNLTAYRLAKEINVSTSTILDLIHNKRKITVEMALRLSKYFGNTSKFWLNLQNELDLREMKTKMTKELEKINIYRHSA